MKKTTVYLTEEESEALRRMATATGSSQAELIREAIRRLASRSSKRRFHSMGRGTGPGGSTPTWDADEIYDRVRGKR